MKNGKHRGQKKQKRKGAYDKSGGIVSDTAAFAFRTKDILKIRIRPRLEPGSDYHYLVPVVGLEPTRSRPRRILNPLRLPFHHTGTFYRETPKILIGENKERTHYKSHILL